MADIQNSMDKAAGKAKEGLGKVSGDDEMRAEGTTQSTAADAKGAVQDAGDKLKGAAQGIKDGLTDGR
ncbi:CsbD family protein [Micrococcus sp. EYE_162]|uniref:CsbD family protein n=1 Tax=unclassified Micrococcus TaxID=2620948 RepID=UPI00200417A8|nr:MULTISPECIES: CsbD family protein [unclassified Micrococcus]MCK6096062.1 CsbD family protein [Micrococcus sp. EYE_212]MCK6172153.1 CsbD family protein [Micrococcus sp. EYE_162]